MLIVHGVPPLGGVKQWWGGEGKQAIFTDVTIIEIEIVFN